MRFMESVGGHGLLDGQNVNNFPEFIRETREFNRRTQANIKVTFPFIVFMINTPKQVLDF